MAGQVAALSADARLGVEPAAHPETVVIDYSAPNVAKEMHVGHLRSTLIGDALARVLGFLGHDVRRENHIGDWGTPFGMLIEHLLDVDGAANAESFSVRDLNEFYAAARRQFDSDPAFAERCRHRVVLLQGGDDETLHLWRIFVAESMRHAGEVYELLGVLLTPDDVVGESFYNPLLPVVVSELDEKGLLVENDGALCVFPEGFENRNGEPLPLIVRKSDGGYGYPATDLAAVRDRTGRIGATRLLYVVGGRAVAAPAPGLRRRRAGRLPARRGRGRSTSRSASSSGPTARSWPAAPASSERLIDLLSEGVDRAAAAMKERASDLSPERQAAVAHALGIGAVKYADLSTERVRDYVFDWDRMLAFEGDTGPYLQYAHARIRSIFRRAGVAPPAPGAVPLLGEPPERALALQLLGFARGGGGDGGDLQPLQAVHLPLRAGHLVHHVLRGLPGAGRRRGGARLAGSGCATSRRGCSSSGSRCSASRRPSRCDRGRAGPYPLPGTSGAGPRGGPTMENPQGVGSEMDLNGTSAIVTGGASGLGLATSRLLAERGVRVVVADLQEDKGVPLAKEIGGLFVQTDVTNPEQVITAVDAAVEMAPLKSLVNCAGIGWATRTIGRDGDYASAHDLDLYRRVIEINLIGTFNCIRLAATKMSLNEPDADGARGAIVNTSSVAAEDGQIGQAAYSSSKGGVVGMTLPVARDLAVVGIRVNTILPGLIDTPIYGEGEGVRDVQGQAGARTCSSRTASATRRSSPRWRSSCCRTRTSTPSRSASTPASGCSPSSSAEVVEGEERS